MRTNIIIIGFFMLLIFGGRIFVDYQISVEKTKRQMLRSMRFTVPVPIPQAEQKYNKF